MTFTPESEEPGFRHGSRLVAALLVSIGLFTTDASAKPTVAVIHDKTKVVGGREVSVGSQVVGKVRLVSVSDDASKAELIEGSRPASSSRVSTAAP